MGVETFREFSSEIVGEDRLQELLEKDERPVAFEGFEPSGSAHIAFALYRAEIMDRFIDEGLDYKVLLADYMAEKKGRMGGDPEKIEEAGRYFIDVLDAAGVDMAHVDPVWQSDLIEDSEYWNNAVEISQEISSGRAERTLPVDERDSSRDVFSLFYPAMQIADMFYLDTDISQMATDQRKVDMLAREVAPEFDRQKPVSVQHGFLPGLKKGEKMDKSEKGTSIFLEDEYEEVKRKVNDAYCPPDEIGDNPVFDYVEDIVFVQNGEFTLERPEKYGGNQVYTDLSELEDDYLSGEVHPEDLKNSLASELDSLLESVKKDLERDYKHF